MTGDGSHNTGRDRTKKAVLKMLGKKEEEGRISMLDKKKEGGKF